MKNRHYEFLGRHMREYHRQHPWRLSDSGLYIPHAYSDMGPESLSYWDDVGFILNTRRIIVRWQHPRYVYAEAISFMAWEEAGDGPGDDWLSEGATKSYKMVGKSKKRKTAQLHPSCDSRGPAAALCQSAADRRAVDWGWN